MTYFITYIISTYKLIYCLLCCCIQHVMHASVTKVFLFAKLYNLGDMGKWGGFRGVLLVVSKYLIN